MPADLKPVKQVDISIRTILIGSIIFAIVFFLIGSFFRHYVWVSGVV